MELDVIKCRFSILYILRMAERVLFSGLASPSSFFLSKFSALLLLFWGSIEKSNISWARHIFFVFLAFYFLYIDPELKKYYLCYVALLMLCNYWKGIQG